MHYESEIRRKNGAQANGCDRYSAPARHAVDRSLRAGVALYRRERQLPGLIGIDPASLCEPSMAMAEIILARLRRALRAERRRAMAGHWTYDLNRHIALRQAYAAEAERLVDIRNKSRNGPERSGP